MNKKALVVVGLAVIGLVIFGVQKSWMRHETKPTDVKPGSHNMAAMPKMFFPSNVSLEHAEKIEANRPTELRFLVTGTQNGEPITFFENLYEKPAHLIIVDNELVFYEHIHPVLEENLLSVTTRFPHPGIYRLYLSFQPMGQNEEQAAFTVSVGGSNVSAVTADPQASFTQTVGEYTITLEDGDGMDARALLAGEEKLRFTVTDKETGKPVTTLQPYLGAYGHLVMINAKTYDYLHVHPLELSDPSSKENSGGGPEVTFMPMATLAPLRSGAYRLFLQVNPDNQLITGSFTLVVH